MDYLRKGLYCCDADVISRWLKLLVKRKAATEETIRQLLATTRIGEHLSGERWWMSHLAFKDLFPTEFQKLKRYD